MGARFVLFTRYVVSLSNILILLGHVSRFLNEIFWTCFLNNKVARISSMVKFTQLKAEIQERLPLKVISSMKKHLKYKPKELWASERCNKFEELVLYATLLKDLNGWSYEKICSH